MDATLALDTESRLVEYEKWGAKELVTPRHRGPQESRLERLVSYQVRPTRQATSDTITLRATARKGGISMNMGPDGVGFLLQEEESFFQRCAASRLRLLCQTSYDR
jgi:hypothetical protein